MTGRANSRPAARPPARPEPTLAEIRELLADQARTPGRYAEARVVWASAWAICRPHGARIEVIDVAETPRGARARPPASGAVAMFRSSGSFKSLRIFKMADGTTHMDGTPRATRTTPCSRPAAANPTRTRRS